MSSKTECIKKACEITDEIFSMVVKMMPSFKTEKDIDLFIRKEAKKRKLKLAFPPVIASAAHASEIHHKPKKTRLKKGFLVMDFGVKFKGYCSDMTRTVHIGRANENKKKIYSKLLSIQKSAAKKAKPGAGCFEIDCFVRKSLGNDRQYFLHSLGHGVGKKVHEPPSLSPKSAETLKQGDIVTVEPGIYVKNKFGIRIEDTILVGKKPLILTNSAKKLIEIL